MSDVGDLAELKWIAEYADLHGFANGTVGLAALVQLCATLPDNYIAFELPWGRTEWWADIVERLADLVVKDGVIEVWDPAGPGDRDQCGESKA